jgi:hypothetical protein
MYHVKRTQRSHGKERRREYQLQSFMADSAQANWNAIRIVYGSGDPKVPMENRECTCLLLWTTSLK